MELDDLIYSNGKIDAKTDLPGAHLFASELKTSASNALAYTPKLCLE